MDARLFGPRLREMREGRGLSQKELAEQLDTTQAAVSLWERGEREPSFEMFVRLAEFFGVGLTEFVEPAPRRRPGKKR
jgi:transcriptional regulator with XRE-family HTH domain